jgi:hypothetical protein
MLDKLLNQTAWVIWRSEGEDEDDYGNREPVEVQAEVRCEVQQRRRDESAEGSVAEGDWLGVFFGDLELDNTDAVIVEGLGTFELVGDPWPAKNPRTGIVEHVEATLRRVAGAEAGS